MKSYKIILAALVLLGISSCSKYLDTNTDPNNSTNSRVDFVLSSAELNIALGMGGRISEQMLLWNQYWTGDQSVVTDDWDKNDMKPSDGNSVWNTFYSLSLSSLKYLIESGKQPKYSGVAKILTAYEYQILVDLYGDVPFTEALQGADATPNRAPAPDKQAEIYPKLLALIDEGLTEIDETGAGIQNLKGDLIFGGDIDNWHKFGNSLKLKILMRQANTDDATIATKVGDLVNTVGSGNFTFTTGNYAGIEFTEDAASKLNANPLYTELEGAGLKNYFVASKTAIDYSLSTSDPRIDFQYTAPDGDPHNGLPQGDQADFTILGPFSRPKGGKNDPPGGDAKLYGPNVPFILMSNWEINLLLSEAAARDWISDDAASLYNAAVQSNFDYFGAGDPSTYLATGSAAEGTGGAFDATDLNSKLKSIALQKWVCMNGIQAIESWIETRRMDRESLPVFQSPGGIFLNPPLSVLPAGTFPSISLYSETEVSFNPNIVQHTTTDKLFWDK